MIPRALSTQLAHVGSQYPAVTVTGPRQSGKTTLCRAVFPDKPYINLEDGDQREFAIHDPRGFLATIPDGAILDEIQRAPELPSYLQGVIDDSNQPGQFILTGSQQFEVMTTITQSLAGRTSMIKLLPFSMAELAQAGIHLETDNQILHGFYPRIYDMGLNPNEALRNYLETYVERDIRQLTAVHDIELFQRFVRLCAGRVGQLLNLQSLANDVGISQPTARKWLTLLQASYIVFPLQPWFFNISKRQIKSPKLYFYDVGLAAALLGIEKESHVATHPLRGNLYENLIVVEALKFRFNQGMGNNLYFWRDAKGNEIDLIVESGPLVTPIEIKSSSTISTAFFKSLERFVADVGERGSMPALIYNGEQQQRRSNATVWPTQCVAELMAEIERN